MLQEEIQAEIQYKEEEYEPSVEDLDGLYKEDLDETEEE